MTLHIRHLPGGLFTDHVFSTMKERDILRFEGPLGTFFLREDSDKPIVLLASGTGFAPVKALVEHMIHLKSDAPGRACTGAAAVRRTCTCTPCASSGRASCPISATCR